jgi:hypothetical protein
LARLEVLLLLRELGVGVELDYLRAVQLGLLDQGEEELPGGGETDHIVPIILTLLLALRVEDLLIETIQLINDGVLMLL